MASGRIKTIVKKDTLLGDFGTLADLGAAIISRMSSEPNRSVVYTSFGVTQSYDSDVFDWLVYTGYIIRFDARNQIGFFTNVRSGVLVVSTVDGGTSWVYKRMVGTLLQTIKTTTYSGDGISSGAKKTITFNPSNIPSGYSIVSLVSFSTNNGSFSGSASAVSATSVTVDVVNHGTSVDYPGTMTAVLLCMKSI